MIKIGAVIIIIIFFFFFFFFFFFESGEEKLSPWINKVRREFARIRAKVTNEGFLEGKRGEKLGLSFHPRPSFATPRDIVSVTLWSIAWSEVREARAKYEYDGWAMRDLASPPRVF